MSTSVWPYDTSLTHRSPIDNKNVNVLTCFIATPFAPKERWDDLFRLIEAVCAAVGNSQSIRIECIRAADIISSGVIHPEIWESIRTADFVICDVSGQNGNVMLELGVAAAWRIKEQVIILREKNDEKYLFDINPARHLEYTISFSGLQKLTADLSKILFHVLATVPFQTSNKAPVSLPFRASLSDGKDAPELYTADITHRRILADCLEFGTPLSYRYSWMCLGDISLPKVHVKADLKITYDIPSYDPFMGIMVRGSHYFANYGHLIFVRRDGTVYLNMREDESGKYHDEPLFKIPDFDMQAFTNFNISIDDNNLEISVNTFDISKKLSELPYVFTSGRVIFIAGNCRIGVKNIEVESI